MFLNAVQIDYFIKNVSSSTSQKDSVFPALREIKKILIFTFIYEPILMKTNMNANIIKT